MVQSAQNPLCQAPSQLRLPVGHICHLLQKKKKGLKTSTQKMAVKSSRHMTHRLPHCNKRLFSRVVGLNPHDRYQ